jgi:hypothetical protein
MVYQDSGSIVLHRKAFIFKEGRIVGDGAAATVAVARHDIYQRRIDQRQGRQRVLCLTTALDPAMFHNAICAGDSGKKRKQSFFK